MKGKRNPEPYKPFNHGWRMMKVVDEDHQNWLDSVIGAAEYSWRKAAYDAVDRIVANHYSPKMPPKRLIINNPPVRRIHGA